MKNLRPFQIALLAGFGIIGLVSIGLLATYTAPSLTGSNPYGQSVEIWGTFDQDVMRRSMQAIVDEDKNFRVVTYRQMDSGSFEDELVNAIAENRAPDAVIINHEDLVTYRPKLLAIPYDQFPLRNFKDQYIDGTEIFVRNDGIYAFPIAVDPLVMYWNRDIFAAAGQPLPPVTWEALTNLVQVMTLRDATRNIQLSTIAFGEYRNVEHAKAALLALTMQSGSRMVEEGNQKYVLAIDEPLTPNSRKPLSAALQFFVEFSNANSPLYSWNRSITGDQQAFLAEDLALYFGFGSEAERLQERNPNLNFDVAQVPQGAGNVVKRTYGLFYGISILKSSDNPSGTYAALRKLTAANVTPTMTTELKLAPIQRAVLAAGTADPYRQTLQDAALVARGWLDPDPVETDSILQEMVEDVVSNRQPISGAVSDAVRRLELAF